MAEGKKFLVSVGEAKLFVGDTLVFSGKYMTDTSIEITTNSTEIRGGYGNALQGVYYHTSAMNITLTDTQWSLPLIALNAGTSITQGSNIWEKETITLVGSTGTITTGTPQPLGGSTDAYVYTEYNGEMYNFKVTGKTFDASGATAIPANATLCVSFLNQSTSAKLTIIPANIVPGRARLFLTSYLTGSLESNSGFIGTATIEVPAFQFSGNQTISMTADGYSNTNITGMALSYSDTTAGCATGAYYAKITEHLFDTKWYEGVTAIGIDGGDFNLAKQATKALRVCAIRNGSSFVCDNSKLTFTSGTPGTATVTTSPASPAGVVTGVADGTSLISVKIPDTEIEGSATVTVS